MSKTETTETETTETTETNGSSNKGRIDELAKSAVEKPAKGKIKALFATYDEAEKGIEAAKEALEAAQDQQSAAVEAIIQYCGKGPFEHRGRILTPMANRSSRLFFRGPGQSKGVISTS